MSKTTARPGFFTPLPLPAMALNPSRIVRLFKQVFTLASILGIALAPASLGQSMFWLNNTTLSVNAPVFDAMGQPLAGTDYLVELWGGTTPDGLMPALGAFSMERVIIPFDTGGYFRDRNEFGTALRGYSTVFSVPPVIPSWLQVRAWDARLGATYEAVAVLGLGGYGESSIFQAAGTDPFAGGVPNSPAILIGLQSFSLRPVPEPSTWALLALGGVSCLAWRWRGRHSVARPRKP